MGEREFRATAREWRQRWGAEYGIVCFSEDWRGPLLWSHYAERHRGLCLGFDVLSSRVQPVTYSPERIEPEMAALLSSSAAVSGPAMIRMLTTKSTDWQYEKEVRAFVRLRDMEFVNGNFFLHFSKSLALREVWVGPESNVTRAQLASVLGSLSKDVVAKKARLAFQKFEVVEQMNKSLWL